MADESIVGRKRVAQPIND